MTKRVQVSLTDAEYEALAELSELRGESMSLILGAEIAAMQLFMQWQAEIKTRRANAKKLAAAERELERGLRRVRGERQRKLDV